MNSSVTDANAELEAARAAKGKAKGLFPKEARVCGVGLTRRGGRYCVKVNLETEPGPEVHLPEEVDGVPLVVTVVGKIRKQS